MPRLKRETRSGLHYYSYFIRDTEDRLLLCKMAMSSTMIPARLPFRSHPLASLRSFPMASRSLHSTPPRMSHSARCQDPTHPSYPGSRKARSVTSSSQEDHDEDLFASTESSPASSSPTDRSAQRTELVRTISTISSLPNSEKKRAVSTTRVGILRQVAQLCDNPKELDELKGALRGWRVMGMRITAKTAEEIVGAFLGPSSHRD